MPTDWAAAAKEFGGTVAPPGMPTDWAAAAKEFGGTVEQPSTPSALSRYGSALWEGLGGKAAMDILGGASRDPQRAQTAVDTVKGLVSGLLNEGPRVLQELDSAGEAVRRGDWERAAHHLAGSAPLIGGMVQKAGAAAEKGDYATAGGLTTAVLLPFVKDPLVAGVTRAGEAVTPTAAVNTLRELPAARAEVALRRQIIGNAPDTTGGSIAGGLTGGLAGHTVMPGLKGTAVGAAIGRKLGSGIQATITDAAEALRLAKARAGAQASGAAELPDAGVIRTEPPAVEAVQRPAPAWQQQPAPAEAPAAPLPDLTQNIQNAAEAMKARAAARQGQLSLKDAGELVRNAGGLQTAEDWKAFAQDYARIPRDHTFDQHLQGLMEEYAPAPAAPPAAAPAPAAAPTPPATAEPVVPVAPPAAPAPPAPPTPGLDVSPAMLEEIAQGMAGKPYAELNAAHQQQVIELARRMKASDEPPPAAAAAPVETPPAGPAPAAPAAAPTASEFMKRPADNQFIQNARKLKAVRTADAAQEAGLKAADVRYMDLVELARKVGEKSISAESRTMLFDKLRSREAAAAKAAAPPRSGTLNDLMK